MFSLSAFYLVNSLKTHMVRAETNSPKSRRTKYRLFAPEILPLY